MTTMQHMTSDTPTEAGVVAELTQAAVGPQPHVIGDETFVVVNGQVVDLERYRLTPDRTTGGVQLHDIESLADYVLRFADDSTTAYIDARPAVVPAIDVLLRDDTSSRPSWRDHAAHLTLPWAAEWIAWNEADCSRMEQEDFARFLDAHSLSVVNPDGATLLELVLKFEETRSVRFQSSRRLASGERSLVYVDESATEAELRLPETIELSLPVFEAREDQRFGLSARLSYRIQNGGLMLWVELVQADVRDARKAAVQDVIDRFREVTQGKVPVLRGEAPRPR